MTTDPTSAPGTQVSPPSTPPASPPPTVHGRDWKTFLFLIFAIPTVFVPLIVHDKQSNCPQGSGVATIFHTFPFHAQTYKLKLHILPSRKPDGGRFCFERHQLSEGEIWEVFALLQAFLFSALLVADVDKDTYSGFVLWTIVVLLLLPLAALAALLLGKNGIYQWLLGGGILGFMLADLLLYRATKRAGNDNMALTYRQLFFYVDIPIFAAILLLNAYVHIPLQDRFKDFFGGAIAFQLMFGNLVIFLIRKHKHINHLGGTLPHAIWNIARGARE